MGTVTVRVPEELQQRMKKYGVEAGEVARKAWDDDAKRLELEEARKAAAELGEFFSQEPKGQITKWIREDRERR
jgi:hypothetical protein